jgi:Uma2 family endonuclease
MRSERGAADRPRKTPTTAADTLDGFRFATGRAFCARGISFAVPLGAGSASIAPMVQRIPEGYRFDPADPRAPSQEQWERMTPAERARVVAMLPSEVPIELQPPEGDPHWNAKVKARSTLGDFFRRIGRKIYVSSELAVYYPGEPRFSPDVLAVLDVEPRERDRWVVADEGKGLDLVIEVHYGGDKRKDYETNVERYARLGIREYFIFDRRLLSLRGYRLPPPDEEGPSAKRRVYRPILPQSARYASEVLGLDLMIDGSKLRFLFGMAPVPEAEELVAKLESIVSDLLARAEDAEKRAAELQRELVLGLKQGVESLCDVLGIELSAERRGHLDALDAAGLSALLTQIRALRRWP